MKNLLSFSLILLFGVSLSAQDITGDWAGDLEVQGMKLRVVFHVNKDGDSYKATMDSPDQGQMGIPLDEASYNDGTLKLGLSAAGMQFSARPNDAFSQIEGTWEQMGMSLPLTMMRPSAMKKEVTAVIQSDQVDKVSGDWNGVLNVMGTELPLIIHVSADGKVLSATMDSPNQNAAGIPVKEVFYKDGSFEFKIPAMGIHYVGKPDGDFANIEGKFNQMGQNFDLTLSKKKIVIEKPKRPQEPKAPFPYHTEDVSYENPAAGNTLAATLSLPDQAGPHPVVILISGSGPQNRDEELLGHKPFLVIADHLTRQGIGVLRFDDRGVGQSTGNFQAATSADFATDVMAGVNYLKTRKDIQHDQIGLVGHSEGGLIAPMVASQSDDVAFIVLLAGPGVDGAAILQLQSKLLGKAAGRTEKQIDANDKILTKAIELIRTESDAATLKSKMTTLMENAYDEMDKADQEEIGSKDAFVSGQINALATPWFQYFLTYDPQPALEKTKCPVLAINGEKDLQVDPDQNLPAIEMALKKGGNDRYTIKELEGLNHLFQSTETGDSNEYGKLEETFSPVALKLVSDWIKTIVK
ncbi:MAG: alpha/beta fold hydrolase [Bacteroidota bacterium]